MSVRAKIKVAAGGNAYFDPLTNNQKETIGQDSTIVVGQTVEVLHGYPIYIGKKGVVHFVEDPYIMGPPRRPRGCLRYLAFTDCFGDTWGFKIHQVQVCAPQVLDDPAIDG